MRALPLVGKAITKKAAPFPSEVLYGDIVRQQLAPDDTVDAVFSSHMLEHVPLEDMRAALRNVHAMLKVGGTFRLIVPDLEILVSQYTNSELPDRAHQFIKRLLLGQERGHRGLKARIRSMYGFSGHRWMYDEASMRIELERAGFTQIRRAKFNDSEIHEFREIEDESRFVDALALEAIK